MYFNDFNQISEINFAKNNDCYQLKQLIYITLQFNN